MQRNRWSVELIVGITATILSVCALTVSVVQTYIMRQQQYASVWPNVSYATAHTNIYRDSTATFSILVENTGVGPAIIKEFKMIYQGKVYNGYEQNQLFQAMAHTQKPVIFEYATIYKNRVIKSSQDITWCHFDSSRVAYTILKEIWNDFDLFIVYEDVYGRSWLVHNGTDVRKCSDCEKELDILIQKKRTKQ